jgi:hypothetical protein
VVSVAVGESGQHVESRLPARVTNAMLVKVGKVLELLSHSFENEITLGMLLHLPTVRHVNAELLAEQLDNVFGQFLYLSSCIITTFADTVQKNVSLELEYK